MTAIHKVCFYCGGNILGVQHEGVVDAHLDCEKMKVVEVAAAKELKKEYKENTRELIAELEAQVMELTANKRTREKDLATLSALLADNNNKWEQLVKDMEEASREQISQIKDQEVTFGVLNTTNGDLKLWKDRLEVEREEYEEGNKKLRGELEEYKSIAQFNKEENDKLRASASVMNQKLRFALQEILNTGDEDEIVRIVKAALGSEE